MAVEEGAKQGKEWTTQPAGPPEVQWQGEEQTWTAAVTPASPDVARAPDEGAKGDGSDG